MLVNSWVFNFSSIAKHNLSPTPDITIHSADFVIEGNAQDEGKGNVLSIVHKALTFFCICFLFLFSLLP